MTEPTWTALLPPLLAIGFAIATRQVIPSLVAGIWLGYGLLGDGNPFTALAEAIDGILAVFADAGDTRVILFMLLIGSMIAVIEHTGGVRGFVGLLERRRWVDSPGKAQWLAWGTGLVVFIESTVTLLVAGALARPLFDRFRLSRERLAYLIDSTSAPICILIPLNAWGAVNLGLLEGTDVADPLGTFIAAVPLNFYAFATVILAALTIRFGIALGPMARADARTRKGEMLWPNASPVVDPALVAGDTQDATAAPPGRALAMAVPILVLVATVPAGLWITGDGDFTAGSGSTAVLWGVLAGLAAAWGFALRQGESLDGLMGLSLRGAGALLPVSTLLLLALALGDVARALGTGPYLAGLVSEAVPAFLLPALIFLVSAFTAFSIGSSFGTFALMIPLAIPVALGLDLSAPLFLAAVLSGAVFGDHASPISDTTVVASMAAATDHIDHVRTQLPYALLAAGVATVGFVVAGALL